MKKLILIILLLPFYLISQNSKEKDTLFIKYDFDLLSREQDPISKEFYYLIKDSQIESGYIYFLEETIYNNKNNIKTSAKIHCLRDIINKANAFSKKDKNDLKDYKLFDYFSNQTSYTTYFLVKKDKFIEIGIVHAIE